jgi:hypothetical protein
MAWQLVKRWPGATRNPVRRSGGLLARGSEPTLQSPSAAGLPYILPARQAIPRRRQLANQLAGPLLTCIALGLPLHALGAQLGFANIGYARNGSHCRSVAISGTYAYACYEYSLSKYDISDPTHPVQVASIGTGIALGVAFSGNYAYVANGGNYSTLATFDISNRTNILPVASLAIGSPAAGTEIGVYDVATCGTYLYLMTGRDGFRIFDISHPTNLTLVGHFDNHSITTSWTPYSSGIALSGNYAFVANGSDGLRVFNLSDPAKPTSVFQRNDGGNALSIVVNGNYAFLANNNDGIRVYDISNPTNVLNVGQSPGRYATRLCVSAGYLYAANGVGGLHVYDIWNPAEIADLGNFRTQDFMEGIAEGVAASGDIVYVANYGDGLRVFSTLPYLHLDSITNNSTTLSWPVLPETYVLQENNDLTTTNWLTVTNLPDIVAHRNQSIIPSPLPKQHYRLMQSR